MAGLTMAQLAELPLSSPIVLNLYTSFVVAITAALAIWGPTILTAVVERAREVAGSGSSSEENTENKEDENKDKENKEEDKSEEDKDKKWKRKSQIWSYGWEDIDRPKTAENDDANMVFLAISRTYGRSSSVHDDHLWIEVNSPPLIELLRFEFKHVEGLVDDKPGIDARELYTNRERLAELAASAPPEGEKKDEKDENADKADSDKDSDAQKKSDDEKEPKDAKDKTDNDKKPADKSSSETSSDKPAEPTTKTEETEKKPDDERPKRDVLSDEYTPTGPELSKDEYDQALRELKILYEFLVTEFEKVDKRLEKLRADGLISWRLLWTLFRHGQRIETIHASSGEKICFVMENWDYNTDDDGKMMFEVRGRWLEWTGYRYAEQRITRQVSEYAYAGVHHLYYTSNVIQMTALGPSKTRAEGRLMVDVASYRRINPNADRWEYDDPRYYSAARAQNDGASSATWRTELEDDCEDLALLPPTTHGWSFVAKKWGEILVEDLSPVPFQPHIFNHLVLRDDYKNLIRSLVDAHAGRGDAALLTDVVTGKGGGLVIVLHGKPGTGKTLTAEAVSEHLERPLYTVSSGELGVATIWKAVLLIDEADVFLEARSSHELQRNALVSVFLRVLEYHSGGSAYLQFLADRRLTYSPAVVLILTTNRIRSFDDAFLSRFSVALRYPDLDRESRKVLWSKFLVLAGASVEASKPTEAVKAITAGNIDGPAAEGIATPHHFSLADLNKLSLKSLNGRVIKQSVRTAQALAVSAGEQLSMSHVSGPWRALRGAIADQLCDQVDTVLKISDQFAEDWKELEFGDHPEQGSGQKNMYA
ncbi:hypothetical protein FRC10_003801 [Ceratobasidium sp. 414]|nr:hypothetical protein FRC10_003801 [Ceratobasidium sp. 414]